MVSLLEICRLVFAVLAGMPLAFEALENTPIQSMDIKHVAIADADQQPPSVDHLVKTICLSRCDHFGDRSDLVRLYNRQRVDRLVVKGNHSSKNDSGRTVAAVLNIDPNSTATVSRGKMEIGAIDLRHRLDGPRRELGSPRGEKHANDRESADDQREDHANPREVQTSDSQPVAHPHAINRRPLGAEVSSVTIGWCVAVWMIIGGIWSFGIGWHGAIQLRAPAFTGDPLENYPARLLTIRRWQLCRLFGGIILVCGLSLFTLVAILDMP